MTVQPEMRESVAFDLFISYARDDDEPFVKRLYADLIEHGLQVWWDRRAMESRGRTFVQEIRDAISDVERVVLVVGPRAVASEYVAFEWGHALEHCKVVVPILRLGPDTTVPLSLRRTDFTLVPTALQQFHVPDFRDDDRYAEALADLVRILRTPVGALGELRGVDPLPAHFQARDHHIELLRASVLADTLTPVVTSVIDRVTVLQGMGGAGKSVIASAFARECETRRAFHDGVAWVRVGQPATGVDDDTFSLQILNRLAAILGLPAPGTSDLSEAIAGMAASLQEHRCLLVLDDVWSGGPVAAVAAAGGPYCRVLATSRDVSIAVNLGAEAISVDLLDEHEALALLASWTETPSAALPSIATDLVRESGLLALAIAMVGATLRNRPQDRWTDMLDRLHRADIEKIRRDFPNYPHPDLLRAIGVSVDALEPLERDRYLDLAVFPNGAVILEPVLEELWSPMAAADVRDLVDLWVDRSLARRVVGGLRLHDLQRDYVVNQRAPLEPLHGQLVDTLHADAPDAWSTPSDDPVVAQYVFEYLPWHLQQAHLDEQLHSLLLDPSWLQAKLLATDSTAVIGDFSLEPESETAATIADAIRLSTSALARNPTELAAQLLGRITMSPAGDVADFRATLVTSAPASSLVPLSASLTAPGGPLLRTIGPFGWAIDNMAVSADFAIAAFDSFAFGEGYSRHCIVRLWDITQLRELHSFDAYDNTLDALTLTSDASTVVTIGTDVGRGTSLRLWDAGTGALQHEIACDRGLEFMHPLPGRPEVLCNYGDGVAILDVPQRSFGAKHAVDSSGGCLPLRDGRHVVTCDWNGNLRLLEVETWREVWTSAGHAEYGTPMALSASGAELAVAGVHNVVDILDVTTGEQIGRLEGRDYPITALAVVANHSVVGMNDGSLELRGSGDPVTRYEHENRVTAIFVSPDERQVVTASTDGALKIWDVARLSAPATSRPHSETVMQVAFTTNGERALSVGGDGLCIVWDPQTAEPRTSIDLGGWLQDMAVIDDSRALICSSEPTLRVLDLEATEIVAAEGQQFDDSYQALTLVKGGRQAVSAFHIDDVQDQTYGLTLWDVEPLKSRRQAIDGGTTHPVHGYRLAWSEDLQIGITPGDRGTGLWRIDGDRPELMEVLPCGPSAHAAAIPGTRRVAVITTSVLESNVLEIWELDPSVLIRKTAVPAAGRVAASVQPSLLVVGGSDGAVRVLDPDTLDVVAQFTIDARVNACALSRDARTVMIGDDLGRVHFLRTHSADRV